MRKRDESEAEKLLAKLNDLKLFLNQAGEPYVSFPVENAYHVAPVKGNEFRRFMVMRAHQLTRKLVPASTINSVLDHIEAMAGFTDHRIQLDVRFAQRGRTLWLDLVDRNRCAVEITAEKWRIVRLRRIIFRRYPHQLEIPRPKRGGDVREIFDYLNLAEDDQRVLLLGWLGCVFMVEVIRPILHLSGPQGSAKTTLAKILRSLIDPSIAETIQLSSNPGDLAQILEHHAVPLFDNLSWINTQVADRLCSAVTGSGFSKRGLYSDDSDVIYNYKRPMIITAINTPTTAPDLLDRFILIQTEVPKKWRDNAEVWNGFNKARPRILGALLDSLSRAINLVDHVKIEHPPRMADFARWGTAITLAAGYGKRDFIDSLTTNSRRQVNTVIQSNPVAQAIIEFLSSRRRWKGSPMALLNHLTELMGENSSVPGWPKTPNHLSRRLNMLITPMKTIGIEINTGGRSSIGRSISLRKLA